MAYGTDGGSYGVLWDDASKRCYYAKNSSTGIQFVDWANCNISCFDQKGKEQRNPCFGDGESGYYELMGGGGTGGDGSNLSSLGNKIQKASNDLFSFIKSLLTGASGSPGVGGFGNGSGSGSGSGLGSGDGSDFCTDNPKLCLALQYIVVILIVIIVFNLIMKFKK